MKVREKWGLLLLVAVLCVALTGCVDQDGAVQREKRQPTAEEAMQALQQQFPEAIDTVIVYDEYTDPNKLLGRPGEYLGKADFVDSRIEMNKNPYMSEALKEGGTLECFAKAADCDARYDYLCSMNGIELGVFGANAYLYKYERAIFRVSYQLPPADAAAYQQAMDGIFGEASTAYDGE